MGYRFGWKKEGTWTEMEVQSNIVKKGFRKLKNKDYKFDYMFPSSHDIFPEIVDTYIDVLRKVLSAKNTVLITSKPYLSCIEKIIESIESYKDQINFRFTITTMDNDKKNYWEANAPSISERLEALKLAHDKGFETSISIEPYLDKNPIRLIMKVEPHVSETIWIGKMSNIPNDSETYYEFQEQINSLDNVKVIMANVEELPEEVKAKIMLKGSIRDMLRNEIYKKYKN